MSEGGRSCNGYAHFVPVPPMYGNMLFGQATCKPKLKLKGGQSIMGKKKDKKNKKLKKTQEKYFAKVYGGYNGGSGKKSKKGKKAAKKAAAKAEKLALKNMRPTLDRKEAKENRRTVMSPVKVSKDFLKSRNKCNHVGAKLSADAFRRMTPSYAAYTPALDGT
ncbi:MAG: hypothetical protein K2F99_07750, partial [Muribaculaceae bacterium]|nr:hypothetical protein [Muribaculaceae bacterium]